ncbi:MAG: cysteine desulfurase NifS [Candidatus Micrarchaeia archaeon]|jgi:cysteine desulfurase
MKRIYLDHSATTPVRPEVVKAMLPFWGKTFGNASSLHAEGRSAKEALETARKSVADSLGAQSPDEIVFTSGGTEADNLAVIGTALAQKGKGNHIITSSIEHHAVLNACKFLEKQGCSATYLPVYSEGVVRISDLERAITDNTILITIMHANNEIGTVQPIAEIGKIAKQRGITFHTDAVQSTGKIPTNVQALGVDLLSISSHKFYGPKGVGALYVRKGTPLAALTHGGRHERGTRSGTENVAGIIGLAKALELSQKELAAESRRLQRLRDKLIDSVLTRVPDSWLNGSRQSRLPNNANFGFKYIEGEGLVLRLDDLGIAASTGSACSSHSLEPSHVLKGLGLAHVDAHGSLRLTLGKSTDAKAIERTVSAIKETVARLREMSPLYNAKGAAAAIGSNVCYGEHDHENEGTED